MDKKNQKIVTVAIRGRDQKAFKLLKEADFLPSQIFRAGMEVCARLKGIDIEATRRAYDEADYRRENE